MSRPKPLNPIERLRTGKHWTPALRAEVLRLYRSGISRAAVGLALGLNSSSITHIINAADRKEEESLQKLERQGQTVPNWLDARCEEQSTHSKKE